MIFEGIPIGEIPNIYNHRERKITESWRNQDRDMEIRERFENLSCIEDLSNDYKLCKRTIKKIINKVEDYYGLRKTRGNEWLD